MDKNTKPRPLDPILTLPVESPVSSICFVSPKSTLSEVCTEDPGNDHANDEGSYSDDDEIQFRSSRIRVQGENSVPNYSNRFLSNRFLASCHNSGEALLWDLQNQKRVATISNPRGGSGTCLRRIDDPTQILFQTRDPKGIVSLHSIERCGDTNGVSSQPTKSTIVSQYETYSSTFCQAAPCHGNKHLIALPDSDQSSATVVDTRTDSAVAKYSIDGHGMVTSLALSVTDGRPILACGMESGTALFFDTANGKSFQESSFSIGKDPILALDLIPSSTPSALLVAAGMAGNAEDVNELSKDQAGRAVIFKTLTDHNHCKFQQRARLSTCRVDRETYSGKPGISVCRFRPGDGRLLAIGGWDKRIRLFERSNGNLVALLKGSKDSIVDIDWAPDAVESGLLASADKNEKIISLWRCFAKS